RQGETWLFFFRFEGAIRGRPMLSMRDGCAGFFMPQEIADSRGIVLTDEETRSAAGRRPDDWRDFVAMSVESYNDVQIGALRTGDLAGCFGPSFDGLPLEMPPRLPGERMELIHRVLH